MKTRKNYLSGLGTVLLIVLLTFLQAEAWAGSHEKQWIVVQERIPANAVRYNVTLKYVPSESTFYSTSRSNVKGISLPEAERIDGYKERLDFGPAVDGNQYSVLVRAADELSLLNADGRQIRKVRIIRTKQDAQPEIVREGYFFPSGPVDIPFKISGQQLCLDTNEQLPGVISFNIYGDGSYSSQGSCSTVVRGLLTGAALIEGSRLEVSVSYKESLRPDDRNVSLAIKPFDEKVSYDSASGKITDVLKLRSAQLVVEKIASDSSEIVLAVINGGLDIKQAIKGEQFLGLNKPVPAFARVDLIRHKLFTMEELCKKAGSQRDIVLIFGDFKRGPSDYYYRGQDTSELTLDENMVLDMLQRNLKNPPVVVFVCRRFFIADLYEKWLGQEPEFYILADYSDPMDIQFNFLSREYSSYRRPPSVKDETLRGQLMLPEGKVSILLVNGQGKLEHIDIEAGQQLAEHLTQINKIVASKK